MARNDARKNAIEAAARRQRGAIIQTADQIRIVGDRAREVRTRFDAQLRKFNAAFNRDSSRQTRALFEIRLRQHMAAAQAGAAYYLRQQAALQKQMTVLTQIRKIQEKNMSNLAASI